MPSPQEAQDAEGEEQEIPFSPNSIAHTLTTSAKTLFPIPLVKATAAAIQGYGHIISSSNEIPIEIVRWPAQGWRPVDPDSGDQGGTTEGIFEFWWRGDTLYARNNAVNDKYLFAWSTWPEQARSAGPPASGAGRRERALIWRANYHPDGGQMFFPLSEGTGGGFVVPLALPGDDVQPGDFVAFLCEGGKGLYIHPSVWHGAVVPLEDHCRLLDRQGRVHARVSVDFAREFGGYLEVPLRVEDGKGKVVEGV